MGTIKTYKSSVKLWSLDQALISVAPMKIGHQNGLLYGRIGKTLKGNSVELKTFDGWGGGGSDIIIMLIFA